MTQGILIGCDSVQQRFLPFWWMNYRMHNDTPVTFVDFGMTSSGAKWCQERGALLTIDDSLLTENLELHNNLCKKLHPMDLTVRKMWYKKPIALKQSPYETTLWIDNDCMIRGSVKPLFDYVNNDTQMGLCVEPMFAIQNWRRLKLISKTDLIYNSGVLVVKKGSFLLDLWIEVCAEMGNQFRGDQEVLSFLINKQGLKPQLIPKEYNWILPSIGRASKKAMVLHFAGVSYKSILERTLSAVEVEMKQNFPF